MKLFLHNNSNIAIKRTKIFKFYSFSFSQITFKWQHFHLAHTHVSCLLWLGSTYDIFQLASQESLIDEASIVGADGSLQLTAVHVCSVVGQLQRNCITISTKGNLSFLSLFFVSFLAWVETAAPAKESGLSMHSPVRNTATYKL